jgi:nucleotide-binding universal stress UspA family protein
MSVRKFLLPVSRSDSAEAALQTGLLLARMWNAHLDVLHIRTDSREIAPFAGEGLSGAMLEDMMNASDAEGGARAKSLEDQFNAATEEAGVPVGDAARGANEPSASFTALMGREEQLIAFRARLADLTIIPHPLAGDDAATSDVLHAVLFDSGRPVLLAPLQAPATLGKRIAVAWNGTARAASALGSAMPFIRQAEAVRVFISDDYVRPGPSGDEVAEYISHHGVRADVVRFFSRNRSAGAGLLGAVSEFGADLMTMGAYSTASRLRQLILGGTTRHVLENAHLPVLMNR